MLLESVSVVGVPARELHPYLVKDVCLGCWLYPALGAAGFFAAGFLAAAIFLAATFARGLRAGLTGASATGATTGAATSTGAASAVGLNGGISTLYGASGAACGLPKKNSLIALNMCVLLANIYNVYTKLSIKYAQHLGTNLFAKEYS